MASFRKLPSGSWQCRVHVGDGVYKSFTGRTKREAELKSVEYLAQKPTARMIQDGDVTVGANLSRYIEAKSGALSPTTVISYRRMARLYFRDLQAKPLRSVTRNDVQKAVSDLTAQVSPKTVRNAYTLLASALDEAAPGLCHKITLPPKQKAEIRIPTSEEVKAILNYYAGTKYELPLAIAAFCGLRREEIFALTFRDIDFRQKKIHVRQALVNTPDGGYALNRTKTPLSRRDVDCPSWVFEIARREAQGDLSRPVTPFYIHGLYKALIRAQDALGIERFRLHDLRHYCCSVLISLGYPYLYIREQMGHASDKMINTVYGHVIADKQTELFSRYDAEVGKLME